MKLVQDGDEPSLFFIKLSEIESTPLVIVAAILDVGVVSVWGLIFNLLFLFLQLHPQVLYDLVVLTS